jgi:hypothetical protein
VIRTFMPPQIILPAIRKAVSDVDHNLPLVDVVTMEEQIAKGLLRERMFASLCTGFGILALVLSVVGLYGVIAYSTSRLRGEIGVRLALGAMPIDVISTVLREGLGLTASGMLMALPLVWLGARYVEELLVRMKPLEPVSMALALGILACGSIGCGGYPGRTGVRVRTRGNTEAGIELPGGIVRLFCARRRAHWPRCKTTDPCPRLRNMYAAEPYRGRRSI